MHFKILKYAALEGYGTVPNGGLLESTFTGFGSALNTTYFFLTVSGSHLNSGWSIMYFGNQGNTVRCFSVATVACLFLLSP